METIKKILSLKRYSFLLSQLVRRDFKIKYRGSLLGVLWSILNPLLTMIVLSVVFSQVFRAIDNYKMYLLSGLVIFNSFSEATNSSVSAVVSNFGMITKVYFPKFILPLSKVLSSAINFCIFMLVFLFLSFFMGLKPWLGYFLIPYVIICTLVFSCGVSFLLSSLQVFFRDTQYLYGILLMIWMYTTPILYPMDVIPENLQPLFKINPLYIFIRFLRQIALENRIPQISSFVLAAGWAVAMFLFGAFVFVKTQKKFIYYS